jgi:hypothetical protein
LALKLPLDFDKIRAALVRECQRVTGLTCILEEPETQNAPRPAKPYFSFKMVSPAIKSGDDSAEQVGVSTTWNRGGQRKLVADFNAYGCSHEDAYNYMALWQSALELETVQANLRASGVAVWLNGSVRDLSQLLVTGFEGRAQMEVNFGIAANLTEDLSAIETVNVTGDVTDTVTTNNLSVTVP